MNDKIIIVTMEAGFSKHKQPVIQMLCLEIRLPRIISSVQLLFKRIIFGYPSST